MAIAQVALPVAVAQPFDYWVPAGLELGSGSVVRVPLGKRELVGVVTALLEAATVDLARLQPVVERLDLPPLPDDVMDLTRFVAAYYQQAIGVACALALPPMGAASARVRPRAQSALRLTEKGREHLAAPLRRAPAATRLFECLSRDARGLDADAIAELAPAARALLRRWLELGYLEPSHSTQQHAPRVLLNAAQRAAAAAIIAAHGRFAPFLLQGVTGSGKSEVYFDIAAACVEAGGQVLMLVPEINLTPQLEARVAASLPGARTVTLHSGLAAAARRANWLAAARGEADLVLGTRLCVFTPMPRLALLIVDEEHDASYKQQEGVRYQARDLAVWRARRRSVPVALGSATPSLESYAAARAGRYRKLLLPQRADPRAALPIVKLVPARARDTREGVSSSLWQALRERLARKEQSLIFVNRRGYAPALKCTACAWQAECPRCSARLVVHRNPPGLRCHHCGHSEKMPTACWSCGNVDLAARGYGTQRLEQALADQLPGARVVRVDRDSTRRHGAFAAIRERMKAHDIDVLVGTQMLAKGHDFPRLTLVGVLGADNALRSADFRSTERLSALLVQVAGRAGRAELPGEVLVQTDFPAHPVYVSLCTHDYEAIAAALLVERQAAGLPPFARLALIAAEAHQRTRVNRFLEAAHAAARTLARGTEVEVFMPVAALLARRAGYERGQLLLRAPNARALQRVLTSMRPRLEEVGRGVRWSLDVDPDSVA